METLLCDQCLGVRPFCGHLPIGYEKFSEDDLNKLLRICREIVHEKPMVADCILKLKVALRPYWDDHAVKQNNYHPFYAAE